MAVSTVEQLDTLAAWNDTHAPIADGCLHALIREQAQRTPDRIAVRCGADSVTYAQLMQRAAAVRGWLHANHVGSGDIVAMLSYRHVDLISAILGVCEAGACYLPIDPEYPAARIASVFDDAKPAACIAQDALRPRLPGSSSLSEMPVLPIAAIPGLDAPPADSAIAADPHAALYLIYTSGSTGTPKGAMVSHHGMVNVCQWMLDADQGLGVCADDQVLSFASVGFDQVQKNIFSALMCGATLHLLDSAVFDAQKILELLQRERITLFNCTPSALYALLEFARESEGHLEDAAGDSTPGGMAAFDTVRMVAFGGEASDLRRLQPLLDLPHLQLSNNYGPTEATDTNTAFMLRDLTAQDRSAGVLPMGRPIRNNRLYVVCDDLQRVPVGEVGELLIGGAGVGLGYLNRDQKTAESFIENHLDDTGGKLYRTGDRVYWRDDGQMIYVGRKDAQVKLRGYRIELGEIERLLGERDEIDQAVAVVRHDDGGTRLVAYLTGNCTALTAQDLRDYLEQHVPPYMVPAVFVALDSLPLTANAKIDRKALPDPALGRLPPTANHVPPRTALEASIVAAWEQELGISDIGVHDGFFDLGGSSLGLTRVHGKLAATGVRVSVAQLFAHTTVARLAEALSRDDDVAQRRERIHARAAQASGAGEPIAIVGMAGRFPGADSIDALWQNLIDDVETITRFTPDQLRPHEPGLDALLEQPNFMAARGVLDGVDQFDAGFFGMPPRAATLLDPQQRLWLETAWQALEHAGLDPRRFEAAGRKVGVFAGTGTMPSYLLYNLVQGREFAADLAKLRLPESALLQISHDKDYIATRTAHAFNLTGPALSIQTACSTALVAIHQACQSLRSGESDAVIAGAVSIATPQERGYFTQEGGMMSEDGRCHVFDAAACGTVFSSGLGAFVLKRQSDAQTDGDRILAVIAGSAVNNDGANKVSFVAPNPNGQAEVIAQALAAANVPASALGYIEAHGTATPLGDPIEIDGLKSAFSLTGAADDAQCLIGSIKGHIGHMDSAAGAGGLVKLVESIRRGKIPATHGYKTPNPRIDFHATPFRVVAKTTPWPESPQGAPRTGGVSAFGVGGTNAHLVVQGADHLAITETPRPAVPRHLVLVVSAHSPEALGERCEALAEQLEAQGADADLQSVAWTLATRRQAFPYRISVVVNTQADDAPAQLRLAARRATKCTPCAVAFGESLPLAFLFPGQGAQHPNMARALYDGQPVFRDTVNRLSGYLEPHLGLDLRDVLYPDVVDDAATATLRDTGLAQPALFVVQLGLARLWAHWGVAPAVPSGSAMLGHSVGEYVAACLAGIFSEQAACEVLAKRAQLMADQPGGSMMAVRQSEADVQPLLGSGVELAAVNGPALCVLSGPDHAIDALETSLSEAGEEPIRLHTSHAFHSAMMDAALEPFAAAVSAVERHAPKQPLMSCLTAEPMTEAEAKQPDYWAQQLRGAVRFSPALQRMLEHPGLVLLECGPGQNLTAAARQQRVNGAPPMCIPSQAHPKADTPADAAMLAALGALWEQGATPDWRAVFDLGDTSAIPHAELPAYPFQRKRYWVDPPQHQTAAAVMPQQYSATPDQLPNRDAVPQAQALVNETKIVTQPVTPSVTEQADRKPRIAAALAELFLDISGIEIARDDYATSFPEMGMDSLLLTQVAADLSSQFGLKLRFRQLLEELSSIEALTAYLDAHLPADRYAEAPPAAAADAQTAQTPPVTAMALPQGSATHLELGGTLPAATPGSVQALIVSQMQLMQQQLALLTGQVTQATGATAAVQPPPASAGSPTGVSGPSAQSAVGAADKPAAASGPVVQAILKDTEQGVNLAQTAPGRFGPYKTVNRAKDGGLTAEQQRYLDELTQRLNGKTAGSKAHAAKSRQHLADPRSIANFRLIWKELVYQIVCQRSDGGRLWDIDDNEYIDITGCFGAGFLGHRPEFVNEALRRQIDLGYEVGPQTPLAAGVAQKLCKMVKQDRATFCNTGSEAVMAAIRAARTVTNRPKVVYFTGDYHGVFDEVLGRANVVRNQLTSRPAAPGILQDSVDNAMILDYGTDATLEILREQGDQIAAVLVEPVQSRYPDLQPTEFLRQVREITRDTGSAFIVDEVITGFRMAPGGLCEAWDLEADICTYGKILGGEVPIGAVAGKSKWLDAIDGGTWQFGDDSLPEAAATFFAGTFVRHPFAMAAANAVLDHFIEDGGKQQRQTNALTTQFADDMNAFFEAEAVPIRIRHCSSWFRVDFPQDQPFINLLWYHMLCEGIYVRESAQNHFFCARHTQADVDAVKAAMQSGVLALKAVGFVGTIKDAALTQESAPLTTSPALKVGERVAVTDAQREVWLAQQITPEASPAYNEVSYLDLTGSLDTEVFIRAARAVYLRHEALALRIADDGETQVRVELAPLDVTEVDLSDQDDPATAGRHHLRVLADTPFDLQNGSLCKLTLLKLSENRYWAVFAFHHLVCDGWSAGLFVEELGRIYSAHVSGSQPQLKPAIPFSVYAREQSERAAAAEDERAYWRAQFQTPPEPLQLPTDRERPADKTHGGNTAQLELSSEALRAAKSAAAAQKMTLYPLLLATFNVLLSRLSGQTDIVVGIPVAGQALDGQNELFGHCVQLLPIRATFEASQPFSALAAQIKQKVSEAYANADCTFGSIVADLDLPRDPARMPLVDVMFNVDPAVDFVKFAGLDNRWHIAPKSAMVFDLFLNLTQGKDSLRADCDYNSDLYDHATIERWVKSFETLLVDIAANPDVPIGDLSLTTGAQKSDLLDAFNPPAIPFDEKTDLAQRFREAATAHSGGSAVHHAAETLSYAKLDQRSDKIAAALVDRGVKPGDRVGISLPRTPNLIAAMIAVHKAGAAYVPLDPNYPQDRLVLMAEDSGLKTTLVDGQSALPGDTLAIDRAREFDGDAPRLAPDSAREAYVIYTSGSTGKPKGVPITHRNVLALLAWGEATFQPEDVSAMLASTSIGFDISVFEIFAPLTRGGSLVLVDDVLALTQPDALPAPVSWVHTVPSPLSEVLRHARLPDSVRIVSTVGEPLPQPLVEEIYAKSNASRVYDLYGPTEATVYATAALRTRGGPHTIGKPIGGWRCYILGPDGQPVPVGSTGELVIGGAGVASGYINRPDKTAEVFVADPFTADGGLMYKTGDLARWRDDGQIEFVGRADTQIKLRGFRIELGEIEAALAALPDVSQAVVAVRDAKPGDPHLIGYWKAATGSQATPTTLRKALREVLPQHMVPQQFVEMEVFPQTPNGKTDRKALPNPFDAVAKRAAGNPLGGDGAKLLMAVWKEHVGEFDAQPTDTFLDLGGHSLLAVRASRAVSDRAGVEIPVRSMMMDSLANLSQVVERGLATQAETSAADEPGSHDSQPSEPDAPDATGEQNQDSASKRSGLAGLFGRKRGD